MSAPSRKRLREFYEREAQKIEHQDFMYKHAKGAELWWHRKRLKHIESYLRDSFNIPKATNFLDVGCAEGYYIGLVSSINSGVYCVGVDISPSCTKKAKSRNRDSDFVVCDAESLPFRENSFGIVLCSEVLEHLLNPVEALKGLLSTTRDYLILSFPGHSLLYKIMTSIPSLRRAINRSFALRIGHISEVTLRSLKDLISVYKESGGLDIKQSGALPVQVYGILPSNKLIDRLDDIMCNFMSRRRIIGFTTIQVVRILMHKNRNFNQS
ncbi:MAG: methyltransferase domain-containing protein [Nitrososphaerales archaeon]|nr:methyltransferase domain-containing protein [Nitrososphaerales archaeon]